MSLNSWTEVLVEAENKKDMTYSYNFKNCPSIVRKKNIIIKY
mgnify:CR=1 FL=1